MGEASASTSRFIHVSFTHAISFKLDSHNFIIWRRQVLATIRGFRFQQFLFGQARPQQFLTRIDERNGKINLDFLIGNNSIN